MVVGAVFVSVGGAVEIDVTTLSGVREVSELVDCVVCAVVVDEVLEVLVLLVVLVVDGSVGVDVVEVVDEVVEEVVGAVGVGSAVVWAGVPPLALALVRGPCAVPIKQLIDRLITIEQQY